MQAIACLKQRLHTFKTFSRLKRQGLRFKNKRLNPFVTCVGLLLHFPRICMKPEFCQAGCCFALGDIGDLLQVAARKQCPPEGLGFRGLGFRAYKLSLSPPYGRLTVAVGPGVLR